MLDTRLIRIWICGFVGHLLDPKNFSLAESRCLAEFVDGHVGVAMNDCVLTDFEVEELGCGQLSIWTYF